jgi:hypothetical protein
VTAAPPVGNQQVVGHKEPGPGGYAEHIGSLLLRYRITNVIPPASNERDWASWQRMAQQFGEPWTAFNNCQLGARWAYYGQGESPTLQNIVLAAGALGLLWLACRE